jgi:hypothetical protein
MVELVTKFRQKIWHLFVDPAPAGRVYNWAAPQGLESLIHFHNCIFHFL